jgi:DNA-binding helix-hairpin-helix protein with protein kinase domain
MRLQTLSNQKIIILDLNSMLGHGGEARVYAVPPDETLVAKVYHKPEETYSRKLTAMLANPPENPMAAQGHISIAWPVDLLQTADGSDRVVGFVMPRVQGMRSLLDFYNPKTRRQKCPFFNYLYLLRTARNIAAAMGALHARGYCVGDVNESNILVSDTALVTLVDTDSFQVRDLHTGGIYRCGVGKPEFTPPELQGKNFGQIDRAPEHDLFGLAVLIFQLLMEGTHPFSGIFKGTGEPPPYATRIAAGHFTYSVVRHVPYVPTPIAPSWEILHPTLRQLFIKCFEDGHNQPNLRPNAQTWQAALKEAENALTTCSVNNQHRYSNHLNTCPWCERTVKLGGRDPFPSWQAVEKRQHLQPLPPKRTPVYKQYRSPSAVAYYPAFATTTRQVPLRLTLPRTHSKLSRTNFRLMMVGLFGGGFLSLLGLMMIINDIQLPPIDSGLYTNQNNNSLANDLTTNRGEGFVAYYNQGNAYYKVGDYEGAIENYSQAIRLNTKDAQAYLNRGNARYEVAQHSGDPDRVYKSAIDDFNHALRIKPSQGEAFLSRGIVRYEIAQYSKNPERDYQQAIYDFNQALKLNPRKAKAYVKRGIVQYKLAQYKGDLNKGYNAAIVDFNKALSLNPQEAEAFLKRGIVRYELAQYSGHSDRAAVEDLQTAAKLFLRQGNIEEYQLALGNICVALDKNCDSFLRNPEKFILSVPQSAPGGVKKAN